MQSNLLYVGHHKNENLYVHVPVTLSLGPAISMQSKLVGHVNHNKVRKSQQIVEKGALRICLHVPVRFS